MSLNSVGLIGIIALTACTALAASSRQTVSFNEDWKFHLGDVPDASRVDFNDSSWRTLNLPHDYSIEGPPGNDPTAMDGPFDKNSPSQSGGGYLNSGIGWYRKVFTLPTTAREKRVAIVFDGVYMNSDVYLNGKLIGNHPYGYTPFQYDLTEDLNFDGPNILAVRCDVEQPCSRWYSGAGIFRPVKLVITDPVHIAPWGTFVTTEKAASDSSNFVVTASTIVRNGSNTPKKCTVSTQIFYVGIKNKSHRRDEVNSNVASSDTPVVEAISEEQIVLPHREGTMTAKCKIKNARLWSTDSPNLYSAVTRVLMANQTVDSVTDQIGFRTIEFTKDKGFLLNGKRLQIQGTCNHHDLGALGSAFNHRALERQFQILKDMGCNALRTAHNPPAQEFLDLADEMGFVVMDEAFDEWKDSKVKPNGYGRFFDQWSERDLVAMIHRDRNHPSVVLWSIGNEIPEQAAKDGGEMAKRLVEIAHREDSTRPTVSACNMPDQAIKTGFADALDVMGINYNIKSYDTDRDRVLIGSETTCALSSRGEYGLYLDEKGKIKVNIRPDNQCASYDFDYPKWGCTAQTSLMTVKSHPWVAGEFVWTGFDYLGEPTPYAGQTAGKTGRKWPSRSSYFGIVDLAGFPKDRYYLYQSQWTDKPMVHLLPHWNWEQFQGKEIPVWAYTNADSVELFLNGQSQGARDTNDLVQLHYEWMIPYQSGTLKAVAKKNGRLVAIDEVVTAGSPAKLQLAADRPAIRADGNDLSFVTVSVLDKNGNLCPMADNEISFSLEGLATMAGLENGDATNHEPFQGGKTRRAFHGLALVILRSKEIPGSAKLTAVAEGLAPGSVTVTLTDETVK